MLGRSGFGFSGAMASHTGIGSDGLGLRGNFSIWEADSLEALHETLTSLPLHPYMDIEIYPLIKHTTTVAWEAENGEMPPF